MIRGLMMFTPLIFTVLFAPSLVVATQYVVGDGSGWTLNYNYANWINGKTFYVGDTLLFQYQSFMHSVDVVTQTNYESCTTSNVLQSYTGGSNIVTLTTPGPIYFICATPGHCSSGMKVAVNVLAGSTGTSFSPPFFFNGPPLPPPPPPPFFFNRAAQRFSGGLTAVAMLPLLGYAALANI